MNRRDFIKIAGLFGLSAFLPKGLQVATYTELMMKMADGRTLDPIEREQLRQYTTEIDNNRQIVSTWQQVNKKIDSRYLDLPIATIVSKVFESDVTSYTVQIPPDYKHLLMMGSFRSDRAASYNDSIIVQYNGDTGTNYRTQFNIAQNSANAALQVTAQDEAGISLATAVSSAANSVGNFFLFLMDYNSTLWKSTLRQTGSPSWDATDMILLNAVDFWQNTSPIRSAKFFPQYGTNIKAGSILTILGIK